ncbi:hypothetical protein WG922_11685 [Ramlibacter sp. AN1015]|uniref:hypothetical protein n=1 Tax=Ramlibacter sp. AN1015 TaxID=3133428 RepID=UPI0030BA9B13
MNRLQSELLRLFLLPAGAAPVGAAASDGEVRALVLSVEGASGWPALSRVWQAVQSEMDLPAPAIAVSGAGCQLWFSLAQPVPRSEAEDFLEGLRRRHLAELPAERVRRVPPEAWPPKGVPPSQLDAGRWSAFVAPDLAPLFADEPWLDQPPGADAQAELLSRIRCCAADDFQRALRQLQVPRAADAGTTGSHADGEPQVNRQSRPAAPFDDAHDPRAFLLAVMRDPATPLPLRIDAAKALLSTTGHAA